MARTKEEILHDKRVTAGKKAARTRKRNKAKGLLGVGAMPQLVKEGAKPVAILLGVAAGTIGANLIAKGFKVEELDPDKFNIKKILAPAIVIASGVATSAFGMKNDFIKNMGYGLISGGTLKGAQVFVKKDLLMGLGKTEEEQQQILKETEDELQRLIQEGDEFTPELPELQAPRSLDPNDTSVELEGNAFGNDLYVDDNNGEVL